MKERITEAERKRFHDYLDLSIDKMNNSKNSQKDHWETHSIGYLQKHINVENAELDMAVNCNLKHADIESECYDLINLSLMLIDNLKTHEVFMKEFERKYET